MRMRADVSTVAGKIRSLDLFYKTFLLLNGQLTLRTKIYRFFFDSLHKKYRFASS